jgi:hypothetical protein
MCSWIFGVSGFDARSSVRRAEQWSLRNDRWRRNRRLSLCLGLTPASQPRAPPLLALLLSWPVVMYSASGVGREQGVSLPENPHPVDRSVIAEVGHATVNEVLQSTRSESGKGGGRYGVFIGTLYLPRLYTARAILIEILSPTRIHSSFTTHRALKTHGK